MKMHGNFEHGRPWTSMKTHGPELDHIRKDYTEDQGVKLVNI